MATGGAAADGEHFNPGIFLEEAMCIGCHCRVGLHEVKLKTTKCGHDYCEKCIQSKMQGRSYLRCEAPGCGEQVRVNEFKSKRFQNGLVHREWYVRNVMLKCYNMTEGDFEGSTERWNKYLETIEDLAYTLTYERDDPAKQADAHTQIEKYQSKNKRVIEANDERQRHEREAVQRNLAAQKKEKEKKYKEMYQKRMQSNGGNYRAQMQRLNQELLSNSRPVKDVMRDRQELLLRLQAERKGRRVEHTQNLEAVASMATLKRKPEAELQAVAAAAEKAAADAKPPEQPARKWKWRRLSIYTRNFGPPVPATPQFASLGYCDKLRAVSVSTVEQREAGGLTLELTAKRVVQEAFSCLFG